MNVLTLGGLPARFLMALTATLALSLFPALSSAEEWPTKPLTLMVGFGAGGGADTLSRLVAKKMEEELGQPVVVRNMAGGGGVVMATSLKNEDPDGYTFGLAANSSFDAMPWFGDLAYTTADFDYLTTVTQLQSALVASGDAPFSSWDEMIAYGKENGLTYASISPITRLFINEVAKKEDIDIRIIPMRGGLEIMNSLIGGHVDIAWSAGVHQAFLNDGKIQVIAALNEERLTASPEVPTIREIGYDNSYTSYFMFAAPKGIPEPVFRKLTTALQAAASSEEVAELAEKRMGFPNVVLEPEELEGFIQANADKYRKQFQ
ncbi:Bug family tripartite tricarboxylate transporter substrate binding protein [Marinobacter sp. M1N3S26]|uniref:Bug family tripartite tricarboxylate transporter substrate binding protein n=1 Tax=unclassified Marinobacter TaxID=83889 RepID=UPI00387B0150